MSIFFKKVDSGSTTCDEGRAVRVLSIVGESKRKKQILRKLTLAYLCVTFISVTPQVETILDAHTRE